MTLRQNTGRIVALCCVCAVLVTAVLAQSPQHNINSFVLDPASAEFQVGTVVRRSLGESGHIIVQLAPQQFLRISLISEVPALLNSNRKGTKSGSTIAVPRDTEIRQSFSSEGAASWRLTVTAAEARLTDAEFLLRVEEIRSRSANDPEIVSADAEVTRAVGLSYGDADEREVALSTLERSIWIWRKLNDNASLALSLIIQSHISLGRKQTENARQNLEDAVQAAAASGDNRVIARAHRALATLLNRTDGANEAIKHFEKTVQASRAAGDHHEEGRALTGLGFATEQVGRIGDAPSYYQSAIEIWRQNPWRPGLAATLLEMGYNSIDRGDDETAIRVLKECQQLQEALGNLGQVATVHRALGSLYSKLDEKQNALQEFERARQLLPSFGQELQQATLRTSIGQVYFDLGQYTVANRYYVEALDILRAVGSPVSEARIIHQQGRCAFGIGDMSAAMEFYRRALASYRELKDFRWEARLLQDIALLQLAEDNTGSAINLASDALKLIESADDNYSRAECQRTMALALHQANNFDRAREYYLQSIELLRAGGYRNSEAWTAFHLGRMERDRGNLEEARNVLASSSEVVESVRSSISGNELRTSYFASMQEYFELFVDVLMQLDARDPGKGYAREAFEVHERGRSRALLDSLKEARVEFREGVSEELLSKEVSIRRRLNILADKYDRERAHNPEEARRVEVDLRKARTAYEQIQALIRAQSPRYAALHLPEPMKLEMIQQEILDEKTVLIEFAVGELRSYVWAITVDGMKWHSLPGRAELNLKVSQFLETVTAREPRDNESTRDRRLRIREAETRYPTEAAALSRVLLRPFVAFIRNKRLLVVSDGPLNYLPFAALASPSASTSLKWAPLILDHELVMLPSASAIAELRQNAKDQSSPSKLIAVLADPVMEADDPRMSSAARQAAMMGSATPRGATHIDSETDVGRRRFARLPSSNLEARAIQTIVPSGSSMIAVGFEANRDLVMGDALRDFRFIHFATHSVLHQDHPELSGIVLSSYDDEGREISAEGYLRLHDLFNLRLPAEMVVLSSCESHLGVEIRGEGLVGIVRGFLYAGARRVVASLWKVDDIGTKELMSRLYRNIINKGEPPAVALRHAQVGMSQDPEWRSPYYWAAFVIQGDWH